MTRPQKLLVLALDAASPHRLRAWAADGTMPRLADLLARGVQAPTRSVEGVYVGGTWPSFIMGRGPGRHGVYWLDRVVPGTYRMQRADDQALAPEPGIQDVLSEAGHTCVVLDVPLTPLSSRVAGPQVVEWGVHDAVFGFTTRPPELAAELADRHGRHPAPPHCDAKRDPADYRTFADQLVAGAAARAELTLDLLARTPDWSFAIQVFSETHCAGHQLWHTHDPRHPAHDPHGDDLLRAVYAAVDAAVGRIVDGVGPDTAVVLVDLHGMGASGGSSLLLEPLLQRLGIDVPEGGATPEPGDGSRGLPAAPSPGRSPKEWLRAAYHLLPASVRTRVYEWRQGANQRMGRGSPLGRDMSVTRAFHVGLGTGAPFSSIRLNLVGREPTGTLRPGAEADAFVAELTAELEALVDPRTGAPAVARVIRTRDLFDGPRLDHLPDLLVEWTMEPPRGTTAVADGRESRWSVESPTVGLLEAVNDYCRTGEHRPDGLVVAVGPGTRPATVPRTLSIVDLAPTFAAALGVSMPGAEGEPVPELLEALTSAG